MTIFCLMTGQTSLNYYNFRMWFFRVMEICVSWPGVLRCDFLINFFILFWGENWAYAWTHVYMRYSSIKYLLIFSC